MSATALHRRALPVRRRLCCNSGNVCALVVAYFLLLQVIDRQSKTEKCPLTTASIVAGWKPWPYRGRIEDCSALTAGLVCSVTPARLLLRLARSGGVYCRQRRCYSTLQRNLAEVGEQLDRQQLIFLRKRGQGFLLFNQLLGLVKLLSNSSGD